MSNKAKTSWISQIGVYGIVFLFGSTVIHALVMAIDWLTSVISRGEHEAHLHNPLFSLEMAPMMLAYGALSLGLFIVWKKMRALEEEARQKDLFLIEQKSIIETAQKLTAIIVEKVSIENAVIGDWICQSKRKGRTVSPKLENATANIGQALQALSRISFEAPYLKGKEGIIPEQIERLFGEFMSDDNAPVRQKGEGRISWKQNRGNL